MKNLKNTNRSLGSRNSKNSKQNEVKILNNSFNSTSTSRSNTTTRLKFLPTKEFNIDEFMRKNTPEEIKCGVCGSYATGQLFCYKCAHPFCDCCIKDALHKSGKCPKCFNLIFYELLEKLDLDKIDKNVLKREIYCPFSKCKECNTYFTIHKHIESCIFKEITATQSIHLNKIIFKQKDLDPCMKTHLLNFLKESNLGIKDLKTLKLSKSLSSLSTHCEEIKTNRSEINGKNMNISMNINVNICNYESKLSEMKGKINSLNEHISKTIVDLAKLTKSNNEKLKNLINIKK